MGGGEVKEYTLDRVETITANDWAMCRFAIAHRVKLSGLVRKLDI